MERIRKTINVSLQSKKLGGPINELINRWEAEGSNLSVQICENLLRLDQLEHSGTMLKVLNLFDLTKQTASIYNIKDESKIEEILSRAITINPSVIAELFLTDTNAPAPLQNGEYRNRETIEQTEYVPVPKQVPVQEVVRPVETEPVTIPQDDVPFMDDTDIPMDFLMNS